MHIPSAKTRQDLEIAAHLRVAGATWETIGERLGRAVFVMTRWVRVYRDEWNQLTRSAEERKERQSVEQRARIWELLRCDDARVRRATAEELIRALRAEQEARTPRSGRDDLSAFLAAVEQISDEQLERHIASFITATRGNSEAAAAIEIRGVET